MFYSNYSKLIATINCGLLAGYVAVMYEDLHARTRYQGQGQTITFRIYYEM